MRQKKISYAASGVKYQQLDLVKRLAQQAARRTARHFHRFGSSVQELTASRGESAFVWQEGTGYRAMVIEGLGTKNRVADAMRKHTGRTYYDALAQDTVAMIINDLIVVGAQPQVITAYFAVGNSDWFADEQRTTDLVNGWAAACHQAGVVWGGGETPGLKGIVEADTIELAGSAVGVIASASELITGDKLTDGDAILLVESNGIHANGLSLARALIEKLPQEYATPLPDGALIGDALLQPTHLYAQLVQVLIAAGIDIHYLVNITGHGWRKLMRANQTFTYTFDMIPPPHPLFHFLQQTGKLTDREMYETFNMGAGFAIYLPQKHVAKAQRLITQLYFQSWHAGAVTKGSKAVRIKPLKITFDESSLNLR